MTTPSPNSVAVARRSRRAWWRSPGFLTAASILATAAVGLNVAVSALSLHFKKLPVSLDAPLTSIPKQLGPWVQVSIDEPLDHAMQDELGTEQYVFRTYVDSRLIGPAELAKLDGLDSRQRLGQAEAWQRARPDAVLNVAVTYYTGMVDTVAHIPERCYVASGYVPRDHVTQTVRLGDDFHGNGGSHELEMEAIQFDDAAVTGGNVTRVAYAFCADGQWKSDSLAVRWVLQDLRAAHAFYAKVELKSTIADGARSAAVMADFLRAGMPAVQKCLPDWNSVERRPVPSAAAHAEG